MGGSEPPISSFIPFEDSELSAALKTCEKLRAEGARHVVLSSEPTALVGKMGVSAVENGKTPDGFAYEWSKQHRGAGPKK